MTDPNLSIVTTNQIGRVYQVPGFGLDKKLSGVAARKALKAGNVFPSITNVLSVMNKDFTDWQLHMAGQALRSGQPIDVALQAGNLHRDFAAARGTAVHNLIDEYVLAGNGKRGMFLPAFKSLPGYAEVKELGGEGYMKAFINFCNTYSPKFIQTETTVYGNTHPANDLQFNYAGTLDALVNINGKNILLDWKCVSKLSPGSVSRQLAAGANATHYYAPSISEELMEWNKDDIDGACAVRLCADETFEVKAADTTRGWRQFQHLRLLWNAHALGDDEMLTDASDLLQA
jgi:hypothetical protein